MSPALILGLVQAGISVASLIASSSQKPPIEAAPDPSDESRSFKKYENLFEELATETSNKEKNRAMETIERGRASSFGKINEMFGDPVTRFRLGTMANTSANESAVKAESAAEQMRLQLMSKAAQMGIGYSEYKRRIWNDLIALSTEQQKLYNERQIAYGSALNSGIANISESLMDTDSGKKTKDTKSVDNSIDVENTYDDTNYQDINDPFFNEGIT